jgi:hypothetical protein
LVLCKLCSNTAGRHRRMCMEQQDQGMC